MKLTVKHIDRETIWRAIDNEEIFPYGPIEESREDAMIITKLDYDNGIIYLEPHEPTDT